MTESEGKQPSHQSIMVAVAKVQTSVEFIAQRQQEHIRESQESRANIIGELSRLNARTAVLESHEGTEKPEGPTLPKMPRWAMAAAIVALIGGLKSSVVAIEQIATALWEALKGGGI